MAVYIRTYINQLEFFYGGKDRHACLLFDEINFCTVKIVKIRGKRMLGFQELFLS